MVAVITKVCIFTYRLLNEINLKSPGSSRPLGGSLSDTPTDATTVGGAGGGSSGGKGQRKPRVKGGGKDASELSLTPSRHSSSSGPMPHACSDAVPKSLTADMDNASLNARPVPMETEAVPMDMGSEIAVSSSSVQEQLSPLNLLSPTVPASATNSEVIVTASASDHSLQLTTEAIPTISVSSLPFQSAINIKQEKVIEPERSIVKQEFLEVKQEIPVKQEKEESEELQRTLVVFCQEALGRGIVAFSELRDKLLLKQTSVAQGHPLREYGVSDEQLESGLRLCGAVEVGQPLKKRLFALTHNDRVMKYSTVVILVFCYDNAYSYTLLGIQFVDGYK